MLDGAPVTPASQEATNTSPAERREELVRFLKALAHDSRLKILGLLALRPMAVEDLAAHLGLESPTVSHHLRAFSGVGLVRSYGVAHRRYYELDRERLADVLGNLSADETLVGLAAGTGADAYERKVLATFLDEGYITVLPLQPRKVRVLLRWVASNLVPGHVYGEEELDTLLGSMHGNVVRLKRELIDARWLRREGDGYVRVLDAPALQEPPAEGEERPV